MEKSPNNTPFSSPGDAEAILSALSAAVLVLDVQGVVTFANKRAHDILGRAEIDILGRPIAELLVPLDFIREAASSSPEERFRARIKRPDASVVVVGFRPNLVEIAGEKRFAIVVQDIGGVEKVREERDRLMQIVGVSEILPAILHELKNPLAAIDNAVELCIEELHEGRAREDLHAILGEIRRMELTIEGLGSMDRDLHSSRVFAIDEALREVVRVLDRQTAPRTIALLADIHPMPLLPFAGSVVRSIAFNLITNAIHACSAGNTISVVARIVKDAAGDSAFEMCVEDDGVGMSPAVRERCREPFFTTKPKGTGIGLALVDRIIKQAGGDLTIASVLAAGTSVQIRVPVRLPSRTRPPAPLRSATNDERH